MTFLWLVLLDHFVINRRSPCSLLSDVILSDLHCLHQYDLCWRDTRILYRINNYAEFIQVCTNHSKRGERYLKCILHCTKSWYFFCQYEFTTLGNPPPTVSITSAVFLSLSCSDWGHEGSSLSFLPSEALCASDSKVCKKKMLCECKTYDLDISSVIEFYIIMRERESLKDVVLWSF